MQLLSNPQREFVEQIKEQLKSLLIEFLSFKETRKNDPKTFSLLKDLLIQLDDLFMIVVCGEFNSGKSAFINSLLGAEILETGVTPTTSAITLLRYGSENKIKTLSLDHRIFEAPIPILKDISLVDTPGTNAIIKEHEKLTTDFIPRSDLVIFITSVDRPFTESERQFLEVIKRWGKKVILVINKSDFISSEEDLLQIVDYVRKNGIELLGTDPLVFLISAKIAMIEKYERKNLNSRFSDLEEYIYKFLDPKNQLSLKLLNPLLVVEKLILEQKEITNEKLLLLEDDVQLLTDLDKQIALFKVDILHSSKIHYAAIDNLLLEYEKRGLEYFENTFRISKVFDLINKDRIQSEYNDQVVKNLTVDIDKEVNSIIEWLLDQGYNQWRAITHKTDQRIRKFQDRILGNPESQMMRRESTKIIESIKREAKRIVENFDKEHEAKLIAEDAQTAVATSAAIEVGALGLGALVTLLATTASADLTGILLAGITAVLGFFIIPFKKKQVRDLFAERITILRTLLSNTMLNEFEKQIDAITININSIIEPYSRFVRAEKNSLDQDNTELENFSKKVFSIKQNINNSQFNS